MRLDDDSICPKCIFFNHECDVPCGEDYVCVESCENSDSAIKDKFYDDEYIIKKCEGFKDK